MTLITPARHHAGDRATGLGPLVVFLVALGVVAGAALLAGRFLPAGFMLPAVCTLLFAAACAVALPAWRSRAAPSAWPTYWDVAGALMLIGVGAAALLQPEQLVALVELPGRTDRAAAPD